MLDDRSVCAGGWTLRRRQYPQIGPIQRHQRGGISLRGPQRSDARTQCDSVRGVDVPVWVFEEGAAPKAATNQVRNPRRRFSLGGPPVTFQRASPITNTPAVMADFVSYWEDSRCPSADFAKNHIWPRALTSVTLTQNPSLLRLLVNRVPSLNASTAQPLAM